MNFDLSNPSPPLIAFLTERHLATLTTQRQSGGPQVTPVGFTYEADQQLGRVITWATSVKAMNVARSPGQLVAICHIDGGRWLSVYGTATLTDAPDRVAAAVALYTARYRTPKQRLDRVVIEIAVTSMVGRL